MAYKVAAKKLRTCQYYGCSNLKFSTHYTLSLSLAMCPVFLGAHHFLLTLQGKMIKDRNCSDQGKREGVCENDFTGTETIKARTHR